MLNQDAEVTKDKADVESEKNHRIYTIFNGVAESVCEVRFFNFVKDNFDESSTRAGWSSDSDAAAIQSPVNYGFSKDDISDTILKFSPSVPSKENVYNMINSCTYQAADYR